MQLKRAMVKVLLLCYLFSSALSQSLYGQQGDDKCEKFEAANAFGEATPDDAFRCLNKLVSESDGLPEKCGKLYDSPTAADSPDKVAEGLVCATIIGTRAVGTKVKKTTLQRVLGRDDEGYLICGVNGNIEGFSLRAPGTATSENDLAGLYESGSGLEVDLCKVVAVAVFGEYKGKVRFRNLSNSERFSSVASGEVDVAFRNTTWNSERDTDLGVDFGPIYFHDGLKVMVKSGSGVTSLDGLANKRICVLNETTTKDNLDSIFDQRQIDYVPIMKSPATEKFYESNQELFEFFATNSTCMALAGDESTLRGMIHSSDGEGSYRVIPDEPLSYEPLTAMIAENDGRWRELVSYAIWATIWAEENGISSSNPEAFAEDTWKYLGLNENRGKLIVEYVGNYGEIYKRNLGEIIKTRGRNDLATEMREGWLKSPPMGSAILGISKSARVSFDFGSYRPSRASVDRVFELINNEIDKGREILSVEVIGHTDEIGPPAKNLKLSERRAEAMVEILEAEFGDIVGRLSSRGVGEAQPVASNSTQVGRAENRRVEMNIRAR